MVDEIVGTATFNVGELPRNSWEKKTIVFNQVSQVFVDIALITINFWIYG